MPTDPSINLTTSAAAAFCARLCVHPLDHLKASLQHVEPLPREHGIRLRLDHLLTTIRHHLHTLHHKQHHRKHHHHTTFREQITFWRGLYHGVPLALIINVPALAFFLSTYDATKHGIAFVSSHLDFSHFQSHHFETHLISGMMAKVAGTILWAPMAKLTEMQRNSRHGHGGQLSLQEALLLIRKTVAAEGSGSGVWSLWSGYRTTLTSLLPYTMLYFATYEKLKQFARKVIIYREEQQQHRASNNSTATGGGVIDYRTDRRPLDLATYMVCVAGAVAISATVCHTVDALRVHIRSCGPPLSCQQNLHQHLLPLRQHHPRPRQRSGRQDQY
ncbi:MAG: mitochondrial carrier domain-containing protein [Linnemannia gamsii]|nr:MAG: mitochondrial carrier domain-containing protein [Linnemannia gamsii]